MKIKKLMVEWSTKDYPPDMRGFANCYIGLDAEHPWFGKDYNTIHAEYPEFGIHGGLTYSEWVRPGNRKHDGRWWVGFDTAHYGDNINTRNEAWCKKELKSLVDQAQKAYDEVERTPPPDPSDRKITKDL